MSWVERASTAIDGKALPASKTTKMASETLTELLVAAIALVC